ncbi:MAG: 50S ribosomal protein L4 [Lachnospiraceae bacterium]|jgi:large subunit ribosomal protein L4|nr:50S ribosomal protein L4 [Lachnospiraceae bacterium]MDD7327872.1 50S ribosomal protein L4 [Lachnospiraceae bacterium]MDY2759695.1 50S ribosomal protein L4 [Lachnospiraceae bacterium]
MATVTVKNVDGKEVGTIDLSDAVFGVEVNEHLVHMAVVNQLANKRQGTQKAKTRSEVSGGGRKPWRQKGTGHARQGSTRAPQWTGGGMVFAPVPRDYSFKMNKKEKAGALKSVLSDKVNENQLVVLDELKLDEIKTKRFAEIMSNLGVDKAYVILPEKDDVVYASAKNIPTVKTTQTGAISVYDALKYGTVILTKDSAKKIEEAYA